MSEPAPPVCPSDAGGSASRLGKIARGGVLMLGGSGLEAVCGFALAIVAGRLLGKHDFGLFNLSWQVVTLLVILSELGLPLAMLRYVAVYDGEGDAEGAKGAAYGGTVFAGGLAAVLGLVLIVAADWIAAHVFHKPDLAPILPIMAVQLPLVAVLTTLMRVTQARGTMRQRVLVEKVVLPTCRLLLIGGFLAAGLGLTGAAWGTTLACAVSLAVAVYLAAGVIRRAWGRARPRWGELKPVLLYAIPLVLSALALFGRRRGIMLALGVSGTAGDVGLYAAAERAALAGAMGLNAIGTIFSPIAADLYNRKRHDELHAILKTSAAWIAMVVLPGTAFLAVFAPEVMSAFGKGFPEGHVALAILAVAQMINCALGSVDFLFVMAGKQWLAIIDLTFFALASMGLTFHLAPRMGVTGAALAGAIGFLGPRMMRATQVAVLLRMNPFGVGQLRVAGCVIPPALLALIWRHHLAAVLPAHALWWLIMPTYFALYAVLLRLVAREQLSGLVRVLRQRRGRAAATAEEQMAEEELPSTPTAPSAEDGGLD